MDLTPQKSKEAQESENKLDEEFIKAMLEIEKNYATFNKHDKIRIQQWCRKLCQITQNPVWKQNRNTYAQILLHCVKKNTLEEPFTKVPPEDSLPTLNKHIVKTRLSSATKKTVRSKAADYQKSSRVHTDYESSQPSNEIYEDIDTPYKKTVRDMTGESAYSQKKFETYNNEQTSKKIAKNFEEGSGSKALEEREIRKLKAELELANIKFQNLENEVEIRDAKIVQLNRKLETYKKTMKSIEEEKNTLIDLVKGVKIGLENESLFFSSQSLAYKFERQFNQHCHEFSLSALKIPVRNLNETSKISIQTSPGKQDFQIGMSDKKQYVSNFDSAASNFRGNFGSHDFNSSKNVTIQKIREDLSLDDPNGYLSKRPQSSASSTTKSIRSTASRYQEVKSFLEATSQNTANFLQTLDKLQKDNEKLKREAKKMLSNP